MSEDSQTHCVIQDLYPASGSEGSFWFLLAKVILASFREEKNTKRLVSSESAKRLNKVVFYEQT